MPRRVVNDLKEEMGKGLHGGGKKENFQSSHTENFREG